MEPSAEDLEAVGESRFEVRLASLIAMLRMEGRLFYRTIRTLLFLQYGLRISLGALAKSLHATARAGAREAKAIYQDAKER